GLESAVEREGYVRLIAERSGATPEAVRAELARVQARSSKNGASRHTRAEIRHNNKGFPGTKHEHTPHGPRAGGDLLSYAEQVILRHVLADAGRTDDLAALDVPGAWSGEAVAGAVALLRQRPPGVPAAQWLDGLPDGAPAALLRAVWADRSIPDVPWEDARRELGRQRGRRALAMLEERLQAAENASDLTAALRMTARLLDEYKRLSSWCGGRKKHVARGGADMTETHGNTHLPDLASIEELMQRGKLQGSLTYREIMDALQDVELSPEQIDEIYDRLARQGVD